MDKARLERELAQLDGFAEPRVELEQYPTPDWLAAQLVHLADTQGDLAGTTVLDLGAGTGMLALAASTRQPARVLAVERDPAALVVARENETTFAGTPAVDWILGDATRLPLRLSEPVTVLMNPPFGAQQSNVHADKRFLQVAANIGTVSYSIHNAGSRSFVESFTEDNDGEVTQAFEAEFELDRQFEFHDAAERTITVEIYRVAWN